MILIYALFGKATIEDFGRLMTFGV